MLSIDRPINMSAQSKFTQNYVRCHLLAHLSVLILSDYAYKGIVFQNTWSVFEWNNNNYYYYCSLRDRKEKEKTVVQSARMRSGRIIVHDFDMCNVNNENVKNQNHPCTRARNL